MIFSKIEKPVPVTPEKASNMEFIKVIWRLLRYRGIEIKKPINKYVKIINTSWSIKLIFLLPFLFRYISVEPTINEINKVAIYELVFKKKSKYEEYRMLINESRLIGKHSMPK